MKVRQKDSFRKLQLTDKSALKAADTPVTKVSAAQLHIHKYIEIMYKFAITCLLLVYLFIYKKTEGKMLPRAQQIQGLSSFAFVCVCV